MIESTLPQLKLLDGFANINIPACLIQYNYYLLHISYCQLLLESHSPTPPYHQLLLLSSASNLHSLVKCSYFSHCALPTNISSIYAFMLYII